MTRKKKPAENSFCEIESNKPEGKRLNRTAFYKHKGDFSWRGIKDAPYKNKGDEWAGIIRRVLIGSHGESAKFQIRYFEISPEGNSSIEKHRHEHVVIGVKGEGIVLTGRTKRKMGFMDTIYISPDTPHQLINPFKEPFGFLCVVNAKRDKPKLIKK